MKYILYSNYLAKTVLKCSILHIRRHILTKIIITTLNTVTNNQNFQKYMSISCPLHIYMEITVINNSRSSYYLPNMARKCHIFTMFVYCLSYFHINVNKNTIFDAPCDGEHCHICIRSF